MMLGLLCLPRFTRPLIYEPTWIACIVPESLSHVFAEGGHIETVISMMCPEHGHPTRRPSALRCRSRMAPSQLQPPQPASLDGAVCWKSIAQPKRYHPSCCWCEIRHPPSQRVARGRALGHVTTTIHSVSSGSRVQGGESLQRSSASYCSRRLVNPHRISQKIQLIFHLRDLGRQHQHILQMLLYARVRS